MTELKETVLAMINNGGTEEDLEAVISHIDNTFLEKEKIDIKMAYNDGRTNGLLKLKKNSEQYYNLTYNL